MIDKNKVIFVNVDTQEDIINGYGDVPLIKNENLRDNLKKLTDTAYNKNVKVVNIMLSRDGDSEETSEQPNFVDNFPRQCMSGTIGSKFIDETEPKTSTMVIDWNQSNNKNMNFHSMHSYRNLIIKKNSFNLFKTNSMATSVINNLGIPILDRPTFIVYGAYGNLSLKTLVEDLTVRGYTAFVVSDAVLELKTLPSSIVEWNTKSTETPLINIMDTNKVVELFK